MQAASNSRKAKVPVPMRTAIGARANSPRATMRTASPGRNPNSARRRPISAGALESAPATETTRAEAPGRKSARGISAISEVATGMGIASSMNAILHENRSHYYYQVSCGLLLLSIGLTITILLLTIISYKVVNTELTVYKEKAMTGVRARGEDIRRFILEQLEKHPSDVSKVTAEHFGITRQAVNKHLQRLTLEHAILDSGKTRNRVYKLAPLLEWREHYEITPQLAEDQVWRDNINKTLGDMPGNVLDIWHYGFTEMFNNAIDHSTGKSIYVSISRTAVTTEILLRD